MSVLVWGAGAIGGTIGAYAARSGVDVTFVDANEAHVEAIRSEGLRISGPIEAFTVHAPAFTPDGVDGAWDAVWLAVKAQHTEAAVASLAPHLAPDGYVASFQNGLNEHAIARAIGRDRTIGAFINFGADVLEPGHIHFGGRGAVVVGELDGGRTGRLERIHATLLELDQNAILTEDIWGYLWGKMGYGAMLFAGALTDESIADTLAAPDAQPVMEQLAREVLAVAAAEGIEPKGFNGFDPDAFGANGSDAAVAASFAAMVAHNRRSAKTHSGVWRDLAVHKRKTEIDAQFEPILELAAEHGVPVPGVTRLVGSMREVESGDRPRRWENLLSIYPAAAKANSPR